MAFDSAAVLTVFSAMQSSAQKLGVFERVLEHEPKSAPGNGLTLAIWWDNMETVPDLSGLSDVALKIPFYARIYKPFLAKPEDAIDPSLLSATCAVLQALTGGFTLGGAVMSIDLLGAHGSPLTAKSAYVDIDGKIFRISDISMTAIIADAWTEAA